MDTTMECAPTQDAAALQLTVRGPLTIAEAARFKEALVEALAAADEVRVDLQEASGVDLSTLQLLCAAHGSAEAREKRFLVQAGENSAYQRVVAEAGFNCHVGCQRDRKSCIWSGGKC